MNGTETTTNEGTIPSTPSIDDRAESLADDLNAYLPLCKSISVSDVLENAPTFEEIPNRNLRRAILTATLERHSELTLTETGYITRRRYQRKAE